MSNASVFLDTAALLALANKRDALHQQAKIERNRLARERRSILTTEWVLTEFLNAMQRPPARTLAIRMTEQLRESKRVQILAAKTADWHAGYALYQSRPDKAWSLVDCISIHLCQQQSIQEVFTADHNFAQAGYRILLKV
ncbi:MAG: type II toxin-antitoxin system VapC family toxin [Candidatus Binatia bacterium]